MLHEITLKNFKLFDETGVTISPGRITVFIGPNGTGKSTVLQALALTKQSVARGKFVRDGPLLFADHEDLVHHPSAAHPWIGLHGRYEPVGIVDPSDGDFLYEFSFEKSGLYGHRAVLFSARLPVMESEGSRDIGTANRPGTLNIDDQVIVEIVSQLEFARPFKTKRIKPLPNTPLAQTQQVQSDAEIWAAALSKALTAIYTIPALRGFERLAVPQLADPIAESDLAMVGSLEQRTQAVATLLLHNRDVEDRASTWLAKVTGKLSSRKGVCSTPRCAADARSGRRHLDHDCSRWVWDESTVVRVHADRDGGARSLHLYRRTRNPLAPRRASAVGRYISGHCQH